MMLTVRTKNGKLRVKDILDINFDMYVDRDDTEDGYRVVLNSQYKLPDVYETEEAAEDAMINVAETRNQIELELKDW